MSVTFSEQITNVSVRHRNKRDFRTPFSHKHRNCVCDQVAYSDAISAGKASSTGRHPRYSWKKGRQSGQTNEMSHLLLLRLARETGGAVKFHLFTVTNDPRVAACLSFNLPGASATIRNESRRSTGHAIIMSLWR